MLQKKNACRRSSTACYSRLREWALTALQLVALEQETRQAAGFYLIPPWEALPSLGQGSQWTRAASILVTSAIPSEGKSFVCATNRLFVKKNLWKGKTICQA